jgi:hypothetical protein
LTISCAETSKGNENKIPKINCLIFFIKMNFELGILLLIKLAVYLIFHDANLNR